MRTWIGKLLNWRSAPARRARAEREIARGDTVRGAALLRTLAEAGDGDAQCRLAELYERGQGVVQSFVEALRWYRAAAAQGLPAAQSRLGDIFLIGRTPPGSVTASAAACLAEAGGRDSVLRRLFPDGLAVPQDAEEAARWNRLAAMAGDASAQARLAYQYAAGLGLERNPIEAER